MVYLQIGCQEERHKGRSFFSSLPQKPGEGIPMLKTHLIKEPHDSDVAAVSDHNAPWQQVPRGVANSSAPSYLLPTGPPQANLATTQTKLSFQMRREGGQQPSQSLITVVEPGALTKKIFKELVEIDLHQQSNSSNAQLPQKPSIAL
jgi:hypothetical protein